MKPKIHWLNSGYIACSTSAALYQSGISPAAPDGQIKPYGWKKEIQLTNGSVIDGLLIPAPAWFIQGAGKNILVDTGLPPREELDSLQVRYAGTGPDHYLSERNIVDQLNGLGVTPEDIDIVIITHLHYDHVGMNEVFTNATFLIHPLEVAYNLCPPPYSYCYPSECLHHLLSIKDQIKLVTGDYDVDPYVKMVYSGGHTEGHYIVFVETEVGTVSISGDEVNHYKNLEYDWPRGDWFNLQNMILAMQKLKSADIMLVGHDPLVNKLFPSGVIGDAPLSDEATEYMYKLKTTGSFPLVR